MRIPAFAALVLTVTITCRTTTPDSGRKKKFGTTVTIDGFIESIEETADRFVVFATTVQVTDSTEIDSDGENELEFDDFLVGMRVYVRGVQRPGDVVYADRVTIDNEASTPPPLPPPPLPASRPSTP